MEQLISIVIPTYNERDNIAPLVEKVSRAMAGNNYEIVFVDDNSRDGTHEAVAALAAKYPVRIIVRKDERGLASAVVHGIANTTGGMVIVMDADMQHPPEVLPDLVRELKKGTDIVVGSRYVEGGGCQGWTFTRRLISAVAIIISHVLLPDTRAIRDPMSGFFGFQRRVVANARLRPTGYKILLEVLLEGEHATVAEVPYVFVGRSIGESKLNARQQLEYLKHIYSLMSRKGELTRFIQFCLVGASGVFVNLGLYALLTRIGGLEETLSAAISVETSILTNFVLNNFITFRQRNIPGAGPFFHRLLKFNFISLAGLGINLGLLRLLYNVLGIYDLVAMAVAIIIVMLWNYLVNTWWTWK